MGHWIERVQSNASIAFDIYDISQNGLSWTSGLALAADIASLALPVVAGGGAAVRAIAHADEIINRATHAYEIVASYRGAAGGSISSVTRTQAASAAPLRSSMPFIAGETCVAILSVGMCYRGFGRYRLPCRGFRGCSTPERVSRGRQPVGLRSKGAYRW